MLPTDKAQDSIVDCSNKLQYFKGFFTQEYLKSQGKSSHHLYITSDDKIEVGDWYIDTQTNTVYRCDSHKESLSTDDFDEFKKIIATTDSELKLPQIPQSFIEEYCRKGGIDELDVEYEVTPSLKTGDNYNIGGEVREVTDVWLGTNDAWYVSTPNNHAWSCPIELKPKLTSDNTIFISPYVEKTYTQSEIDVLINKLEGLPIDYVGKSISGIPEIWKNTIELWCTSFK